MDVLHGDDLCQFIQAVDILDLIQELHTAEEKGNKKIQPLRQNYTLLYFFLNMDSLESLHWFRSVKKQQWQIKSII